VTRTAYCLHWAFQGLGHSTDSRQSSYSSNAWTPRNMRHIVQVGSVWAGGSGGTTGRVLTVLDVASTVTCEHCFQHIRLSQHSYQQGVDISSTNAEQQRLWGLLVRCMGRGMHSRQIFHKRLVD